MSDANYIDKLEEKLRKYEDVIKKIQDVVDVSLKAGDEINPYKIDDILDELEE